MPNFAPHWYSLPRWIWAPLPQAPEEAQKIVTAAITGGDDVTSMPRYFKGWEQGLPSLRAQLRRVDALVYFAPSEKKKLQQHMQAAGLPIDQLNAMALMGRGHPLLAVFDPGSAKMVAVFRSK